MSETSTTTPISRYNHDRNSLIYGGEQTKSGEVHSTWGRIIMLYDREEIEANNAPGSVINRVINNPGLLMAKVSIRNTKQEYILPFEKPIDEITLVGGNSVLLEQSIVEVCYRNGCISSGWLRLVADYDRVPVNLSAETEIYSIGGIFS